MKIICIGLNYRKHALEMNRPFPDEPVVFLKPDSTLLKKNKPFFLPDFSEDIQYEIEVVIKISKLGKSIEPRYASRYYDEMTLGVDITARDIQTRLSRARLPWELSKCFDGAAPIGKFVPVTMVKSIDNTGFRLDINGKCVQEGNTSDMIFSINEIVSYVSRFFTLKTGDLIFTGTPPGVGPLKKNDRLRGYLENELLIDFRIM
jgi:2-keto-4-pentenoate hydratase/2-oxohepta-3-ene-1,7-dioic acid hydratase in catechol pathway